MRETVDADGVLVYFVLFTVLGWEEGVAGVTGRLKDQDQILVLRI